MKTTFVLSLARARLRLAIAAGTIALGAALSPLPAGAVALVTDASQPPFGQLAMNPNDDGSSSQLNLPFAINFFGQTHNNFWINNNGNLTFNASVGQYTPTPFPASSNPMIAPFWGDVDTRCSTCGSVFVSSPNADTVVVTWNNVGYYSAHSNKLNDFQAILRNRAGTLENGAALPTGDFDIEFRYNTLQWTTGDASGGSNGLGGTPAQAGFDAGDHVNFFTLPGSRTSAVLNLANTSNIAGGPGGLWTFAIRSGGLPGSTPQNPLMPVQTQAGWDFDFNVVLNQQVFIDPHIAIGYDYIVASGPLMTSVLLPTGIGDDLYNLWLWNGTDWVDTGTILTGGVSHTFVGGAVDRFRILGIETSAALDSSDPTAFVTGLTFNGTGNVVMSMNAITFQHNGAGVPEPPALLLVLLGLGVLSIGRLVLRRQRVAI